MALDLKHLVQYARRWWWLLLIVPILCAGTAYLTASRQQSLYRATATLEINLATGTDTDIVSNIYAGQTLATTYQELAVTDPVLREAAARLGPPYTAESLAENVSASTVRETLLLQISASDTDPERAARIANEVAEVFARSVDRTTAARLEQAQTGVDVLIADAEAAAAATRAEIDRIRPEAATDPQAQARLDELRGQYEQEVRALNDYRSQRASLTYDAALSRNTVSVREPAMAPASAYAPRVFFYTMLALFFGGILAVGLVGLLEYFDNTVKVALDFPALIGAPLLSVVGLAPKMERGRDQLFVLNRPDSTMAEAVRLLRTNIEFAAATREIGTLAITSATPNEGKSTITANLAVAMVQAGFSVAVVDADLRRPSLHKIFDVPNARGLTTLLTRGGTAWRAAAVRVLDDLWLVPSGPLPPNPADLLSSDRMHALLSEVGKQVDIVLIDTPPVLVVSDPLVVATNVDAVLLVSWAGRTRSDALKRAATVLHQGSVRLIGVVLNQQRGRDPGGYDYYYASEYYGVREKPNGRAEAPESAAAGPQVPARSAEG